MSCENKPNRIARLAGRVSAGISQLAAKRGLYAGLALGGAGLSGAGLVALARRQSQALRTGLALGGVGLAGAGLLALARRQGNAARPKPPAAEGQPPPARPPLIDPRQLPHLPARKKVKPTAYRRASDRCTGCKSEPQSKPGPWYRLAGRLYCQDCAPAAARQAEVDLVRPAPARPADRAGATKRPASAGDRGASGRPDRPLDPGRRIKTRLTRSRLRVNIGHDGQGQPAWVIVKSGFVVLRPDGTDTGLAIAPRLKKEGQGPSLQFVEDPTGWEIVHIDSGLGVHSGWYRTPQQAERLASVLAQLDWTRSAQELTPADLRRAQATVSAFDRALDGQKETPTGAVPRVRPGARRPPAGHSLTGRIVADNYGGIARVLEDSGDRLFLIDHLGQRYELARTEVWQPTQQDYELARVAQSVNPAAEPEAKCARCGRPANQAEAGERWTRMAWQTFCPPCAAAHREREPYLSEAEIGDELEQI